MQGTVDVRDRNGFHPFSAVNKVEYTRAYFTNKLSALRHSGPGVEDIDLSNPQARIVPGPPIRNIIKGTLFYYTFYPFLVVLNGQSFAPGEGQERRRDIIANWDLPEETGPKTIR